MYVIGSRLLSNVDARTLCFYEKCSFDPADIQEASKQFILARLFSTKKRIWKWKGSEPKILPMYSRKVFVAVWNFFEGTIFKITITQIGSYFLMHDTSLWL